MTFKLALKNVRRSIKDYTIYFLTLTIGVCIFYVFNAIETQQAMIAITEQQASVFSSLTSIMNYVSVFIAMILAFLVLYANKFLIKRRKKELGIYMTLGMSRQRMSFILILETLLIGIISLGLGLISGFFISEFMAVLTAKLFEAPFIEFKFVFSADACLKTVLYFSLIFLITMLFNTLSISRCRLIDLLSADKKNENFKAKKLWHSVVFFIISVLCLAEAYHLILTNGLININAKFTASLVLGTLGTLLFFMSLSGFLLRVVQSSKRLYLKNLNLFILRQINSKINTTYLSMTIICIMLLVTIGTLSSGISLANTLTGSTEAMTPFDLTITSNNLMADSNGQTIPYHEDIAADLIQEGYDVHSFSETLVPSHTRLASEIPYGTFLEYNIDGLKGLGFTDEAQLKDIKKEPTPVVSLSDFNRQLTAMGQDPISLTEDQFLVTYDLPQLEPSINSFIKENGTITLNGRTLKSLTDKGMNITTGTCYSFSNTGTLILPDSLAETLPILNSQLSLLYKDTSDAQAAAEAFEASSLFDYSSHSGYNTVSKVSLYTQNLYIKLMTSYVGIYVGFVFLIASAAVLALQQLSEAADSIPRYELLKKIGVDRKMLRRAVFIQVAIYFMIPLALAVVHSVVGIKAANDFISLFGNIDVAGNSGITAIILILIYGAYFIATYLGSLSILKEKQRNF